MATEGLSKEGSINHLIERVRVSSVLNKDVKQFGKQHLTDEDDETCWNSDQGLTQSITVQFKNDVIVSEILIRFQGGFSAGLITVENTDKSFIIETHLQDNSDVQRLQLGKVIKAGDKLNIALKECRDPFGRVTIYSLNVIGEKH